MTDPHGPFILDPTLRLSVWTVTAELADPDPADGGGIYLIPHPMRVPAYTPAEAVQAAASMSGIDRANWNDYLWTATQKGTEP